MKIKATHFLLFLIGINISFAQLATNTFTAGWATFGQVLPQGKAFDALQVGSFLTQTDVKNRWPDGSIRFAVVTVNIISAGNYPITIGDIHTDNFVPTIPSASVQFIIGGTNNVAALPASVSDDLWLNGLLVKEWRQIVTPTDGLIPQPYLRVYFDTRVYVDGTSRVDVNIENTLDTAGGTDMAYDVNIIVNDTSVFSQAAINHWYLTRWRKTFAANGLDESETYHDFSPFTSAGAIPKWDSSLVMNNTWSLTGTYDGNGITYENFGILGRGAASYNDMYAPGGRTELGPYPDVVAQYVTYKTQNQRNYVILSGNESGSWSMHLREPNGSLVSIDNRPQFWLDGRCGGGPDCPRGNLNINNPLHNYNNDHVPSLSYVPYLITGDRYFVDEMKFAGNAVMLQVWPNCGPNYSFARLGGVIMEGNPPRGLGWGMRNLVDAAAYTPDSDSLKSYFVTTATNNLVAFDKFSNGEITRNGHFVNPFGSTFEYYNNGEVSSDPTIKVVTQPQWQNNYIAWSMDHAAAQGFTAGAVTRDRIAKYQLGFFTDQIYPTARACPYYPTTGVYQADGTTIDWFQNLGDLYNWNLSNNVYFGALNQFSGYYGVDARLSLIIAVKQGMPGAQAAYDWLMQQLSAGDFTGRWSIALDASSVASSVRNVNVENSAINIFSYLQTINITKISSEKISVEVCDLLGRTIYTRKNVAVNAGTYSFDLPEKGVYLVKTIGDKTNEIKQRRLSFGKRELNA